MKGLFLAGLILLMTLSWAEGQSRVWNIAIGHEWGSHEYIDTDGYLKGFGFQLIDLVCGEGNMDCRVIWDKYNRCWVTNKGDNPSGGRGLFARWYDACTSWVPTLERIHTFDFTTSHFKTQQSFFYVLKGDQLNPSNLQGKRIGFFDGWASNEKCIARQGNIRNFQVDLTQFYDSPSDAIKALNAKDIDAFFGNDVDWSADQWNELDKVSGTFSCFLGGNAMMARKDNPFVARWNVGFNKLINSNQFTKFCKQTNDAHAHKGDPFDCIGA